MSPIKQGIVNEIKDDWIMIDVKNQQLMIFRVLFLFLSRGSHVTKYKK